MQADFWPTLWLGAKPLAALAVITATVGFIDKVWLWARKNRVGPLRLLSRGIDYVRASGFLSVIMLKAAWQRRDRWSECLNRAREER